MSDDELEKLAAAMRNVSPSGASRKRGMEAAMAAFDTEFAQETAQETVKAAAPEKASEENIASTQGSTAAARPTGKSIGDGPVPTLGSGLMAKLDRIFFNPKAMTLMGSCAAALIAVMIYLPNVDTNPVSVPDVVADSAVLAEETVSPPVGEVIARHEATPKVIDKTAVVRDVVADPVVVQESSTESVETPSAFEAESKSVIPKDMGRINFGLNTGEAKEDEAVVDIPAPKAPAATKEVAASIDGLKTADIGGVPELSTTETYRSRDLSDAAPSVETESYETIGGFAGGHTASTIVSPPSVRSAPAGEDDIVVVDSPRRLIDDSIAHKRESAASSDWLSAEEIGERPALSISESLKGTTDVKDGSYKAGRESRAYSGASTGYSAPTASAPVPAPPPPPPPIESAPVSAPDEIAVVGIRKSAPIVSAPAEVYDEVVVTGGSRKKGLSKIFSPIGKAFKRDDADKAEVSVVRPEPVVEPVAAPKPQPTVQSGLLTAGDYDAVLNPDLYKVYVDKMLQGQLRGKDLPYVDANQRINIRVVDARGKPVPMADVSLETANGQAMFPLRTGADGMVYIYPGFDGLKRGVKVIVSADGGRSVQKTLTQRLVDKGGDLKINLSNNAQAIDSLDLLLTIDATGSMADEMKYLQSELKSIVGRVEAANPNIDIRTGLVVYRDKGDEYVVRTIPFTDDIDDFRASLGQQKANGGGDTPEAMHTAMEEGLKMGWREDAIKVNLLVADAPPHDQHIADTWRSGLISRTKGIHIVPLAASGVDKTAEFLMRSMGQITGGRYLFLTDDSGVGNPHAEPTVDCYIVTRLDGLVTRTLSSLLSGARVEPEAGEIIRSVGNYRSGVCKLDEQSPNLAPQNVSLWYEQ